MEATCPTCGTPGATGRSCSNCGSRVDEPLIVHSLDPAGPTSRAERRGPPTDDIGTVERGRSRHRARNAGVALLLAGALGALVAGRVDRSGSAGAPKTSAARAGVTTTLAGGASAPDPTDQPATENASSASSPPALPTATTLEDHDRNVGSVPVPEGLVGLVDVALSDGRIMRLDLADGSFRTLGTVGGAPVDVLVPRGTGVIVVTGLQSGRPSVRLLEGTGGRAGPSSGIRGRPRAWSRDAILLDTGTDFPPGSRNAALLTDTGPIDVVLPALHRPVGVVGAQVVVQVGDHIARFDPGSGTFTAVADGTFIAGNDAGLVRTVCEIGRCELHTGPWVAPDQWTVPVPEDLWPLFLDAQLSPGGPTLLARTLSGNQRLVAVDLVTGARREVTVPWPNGADQYLHITPDGRFALGSEGSELVLYPLDGPAPQRVGPLPAPVLALAVAPPDAPVAPSPG